MWGPRCGGVSGVERRIEEGDVQSLWQRVCGMDGESSMS
jgi:hypothetical protein